MADTAETRPKQRGSRTPLALRLESWLRGLESRAVREGRKRIRIPFYVARVSVQVFRQWMRDRCPQQAASLAFQTVLSIVPILAVGTAALRAMGLFSAESSLIGFMTENLIPVSRRELSERLVSFSKNISFETVGVIGLITSVVLAFVMFNALERIINFVWRAEKRRSVTQKFVVFYFMLSVGPVLVGLSLVQAAKFGLTSGVTGALLSLSASFLALFLINLFLPVPRVRVGPALAGAAISAILFELAKLAFSTYVASFALPKYSGIYGAMAVIPLWLIWIYWSWLMLLLGVEISHAVQNLSALESMDRRGRLSLESEMLRRVNGPVAARIMVAVTQAYSSGDKGISRQAISDRFDLSEECTDRLVDRLIDADLLLELQGQLTGLVPARPPDSISLSEVLAPFRGDDIDAGGGRRARTVLDRVLKELEDDTRAVGTSHNLAELARLADR